MNSLSTRRDIVRDRAVHGAALLVLLVIGALALVGPSGVLAWGEDLARLEEHRERVSQLQRRNGELENRVRLLDPDHVDPDLASELVRRDLNVAHPDEYVIDLAPAR